MDNNEKNGKLVGLDFAYIYMALGVLFIAFTFANLKWDLDEKIMQSLLFIMLGLIIGGLGYERYKQKLIVENKLIKLEKDVRDQVGKLTDVEVSLQRISTLKLIEGVEDIHRISETEIQNAKHSIRATHFRRSKFKRKSNTDYYTALAKRINASDVFSYDCCFNKESFDSSRFNIFGEIIEDKGKYAQMSYFEFTGQAYLNIMIFDQESAYIGFPTNAEHDSMRYMIKFSANNPKELEVIKNLTKWYDKVLIPTGQKRTLEYVKHLNDF